MSGSRTPGALKSDRFSNSPIFLRLKLDLFYGVLSYLLLCMDPWTSWAQAYHEQVTLSSSLRLSPVSEENHFENIPWWYGYCLRQGFVDFSSHEELCNQGYEVSTIFEVGMSINKQIVAKLLPLKSCKVTGWKRQATSCLSRMPYVLASTAAYQDCPTAPHSTEKIS